MSNNFWKIFVIVLTVLFISSLATNTVFFLKNINTNNLSLIKTVSAQEVYPIFECPCCGKPIDECTCGMAVERKNYIDVLINTSGDSSKDDIVLAYAKKYGLNSFMDKVKQDLFREKLIKEASENRPIISLSPDSYDFGDVSQKKGVVVTFFKIKNEGKEDLIIDKLDTSCGCTSASIIYQGKEGSRFAMPGHGINEAVGDWQVVILPGQEVELKVYYDPNVHKDFRGTAIREISVFSNDPIDFQKSVKIELNQVN